MNKKRHNDLVLETMNIRGENYILRKLQFKDSEQLHSLDEQCFESERAFTLGYFLLLFFYEEAFGWALEDNDQMSAFILITKKRNNANIATIDVHPDYRRKGLGTALLSFAEQYLADNGLKSFTLQVEIDNDSAIAMYKKSGFSIVKSLPNYYPGNSAYLMKKRLSKKNRGTKTGKA